MSDPQYVLCPSDQFFNLYQTQNGQLEVQLDVNCSVSKEESNLPYIMMYVIGKNEIQKHSKILKHLLNRGG